MSVPADTPADAGIDVRESDDFAAFWHILEATLEGKHGAKPTHTLEEIRKLRMCVGNDRLRLMAKSTMLHSAAAAKRLQNSAENTADSYARAIKNAAEQPPAKKPAKKTVKKKEA